MKWIQITRGKPQPRGKNDDYPGLMNVDVELKSAPPREWADYFSTPFAAPMRLSMHQPMLSGSTVRLMPPDDEFDDYIQHLDARIAATNEWYERNVLPQRLAAEERTKREQEEDTARLAEAKRKAERY